MRDFLHSAHPFAPGTANLEGMEFADKLQALEASVRDWLRQNEIPQPDEVQHREVSIALLWHDSGIALPVYLDEAVPPDVDGRSLLTQHPPGDLESRGA